MTFPTPFETFSAIFVCQRYCVQSLHAFNLSKSIFNDINVLVISDDVDLPFLECLRSYQAVKYETLKNWLETLAIRAAPALIYYENGFEVVESFDQASINAIRNHFKKLK